MLLLATLGLATVGAPARADTVAKELFAIGLEYCNAAFVRDIGSFDSQPHLRALVAQRYPKKQFCNCVATEFSVIGDDEMATWLREEIAEDDDYFVMASFLDASMGTCVPIAPTRETGGLGIDLGLDDADLNFEFSDNDMTIEEVLADNMFAPDQGDIDACQMALDDTMMLPGFNPAATLARIRSSGQTRGDVCTCAGSYIASLGEPFQEEVEAAMNPAVVYGSSLAAGINMCIDD